MIGIEIKERLGNQLFRYAYARRLQIDRGGAEQLLFGLSSYEGKDPAAGWCDSLKAFNTVPYESTVQKLVYSRGSVFQKLLLRSFYADMKVLRKPGSIAERNARQNSWNAVLQKHGLSVCYDNCSEPAFPPDCGNIFLDGSFENPKYFNSIRDILLSELTPKEPRNPDNALLYKVIEESNSVCVSVRRGDFLSPQFKGVFDVCGAGYFKKAIAQMRTLVGNPVFIFFSDDIAWVRENLGGPEDYYETGLDPVWEKLRLMYSCKHFIIPNSTFSWWAQYLGRNENKIVIAPERWYNDDRPQYLLLDSFFKLPAE